MNAKTARGGGGKWTKNPKLQSWLEDVARLCQPSAVHVCTGSAAENRALLQQMVNVLIVFRTQSL